MGSNLRGANLSEADLPGADLRDAYLNNAVLSGANLSKADLCNADLSGADLQGAYLFDAKLSGANLEGAFLMGVDLRGIELSLEQVLPDHRDLSDLPQALLAHTRSNLFDQKTWGYSACGSACCLAGFAAEYIGLPGNSGVGVLTIKKAMPDFDLDVLYQQDPSLAINELKKFVKQEQH